MRSSFRPLAILSLMALSISCDSESKSSGSDSGGAKEAGLPDVGPPPKQTCIKGRASTHLEGPQVAIALVSAPHRPPTLALASGPRSLVAGTIGEDLEACVKRTGCLALAYLPDAGDSAWQRLRRRGIHRVDHFSDRYYILALEEGAGLQAAIGTGDLLAADLLRATDKLPPDTTDAHRRQTGRVALVADARGRTRRRTFEQLKLPLSRSGELSAARRRWVYRVGTEPMTGAPTTMESREATGVDEVQGFGLQGGAPRYSGYSGEGIVVMVMEYDHGGSYQRQR